MRGLCVWVFMMTLISSISTSTNADMIELVNGEVIEGTIVDQSSASVIISVAGGTMVFAPNEIKAVHAARATVERAVTFPKPSSPPPSFPAPSVPPKPDPVTPVGEVSLGDMQDYFVRFFGTKQNFFNEFAQLQRTVQEHPDNADAHYKLGISYFYVREYDNAVKELSTALNYRPNDTEALRFLVHAYVQLGDTTQVIEHGERYLAIRPFDSKMRSLVADTCYQDNNREKALFHYERLYQGDTTNRTAIKRLIELYEKSGNKKKVAALKKTLATLN